MTSLRPFPDVELAVCDVLEDLAPTGTITPADLQGALPFIRVARFGGGDDLITDRGQIDVDVFAADRSGLLLAEQVRQLLISGPHRTAHGVLDRTRTNSAPTEVPWTESATIRRWTASYQLSVRR